jgi:3'-phosphoadenosine 5'-phosphosulfate sulfotransferase (PAPS reductase)/FAD synthetase
MRNVAVKVGMQVNVSDQQLDLSVNLLKYDYYLVAFSGGKDSIACVLHLLELGIDPAKIELWHNNIDGKESAPLMDWPSTPAYCRAFAKSFGLAYYESWREGGFEREMLRNGETASAKVWFETPEGLRSAGGNGTTKTVREQFPQLGAITNGRWCSAVLKIDVMSIAINNQARFLGKRTLVISGERAQESEARAKYATFEPHRCNTQSRHVDAYRAVHSWTEKQVWASLERHSVNPHPAYRLGWGRLSCALCIFGGANQWASARKVLPTQFMRVAIHEGKFGKTIDRSMAVKQKADKGIAYPQTAQFDLVEEAKDVSWNGPIRTNTWQLPAGAFSGETCGPE